MATPPKKWCFQRGNQLEAWAPMTGKSPEPTVAIEDDPRKSVQCATHRSFEKQLVLLQYLYVSDRISDKILLDFAKLSLDSAFRTAEIAETAETCHLLSLVVRHWCRPVVVPSDLRKRWH